MPTLCAFVAPTTDSYRRLVPGYEAPINIVYSQRNRSAAVRIPMYSPSEKSKRLESRTPDPSCNPYFAFAAMLMAGLDGIVNKTEPPPPIDKNLYDLPPRQNRNPRPRDRDIERSRLVGNPNGVSAVARRLYGPGMHRTSVFILTNVSRDFLGSRLRFLYGSRWQLQHSCFLSGE